MWPWHLIGPDGFREEPGRRVRVWRFGTSRRSAGTALWSFGLEPAEAVSTHSGDFPWCEEGEGSRDGLGPAGKRALIGPDPFQLS